MGKEEKDYVQEANHKSKLMPVHNKDVSTASYLIVTSGLVSVPLATIWALTVVLNYTTDITPTPS